MAVAANEVSGTGCLWILFYLRCGNDLHAFGSFNLGHGSLVDSEKAKKRMEMHFEPLSVPGRKRTMMHDKTDCPGSNRCFMRLQDSGGNRR